MQTPVGVAPRVFCAPGRINLIGEHTDYNDGFAMPAAINLATRVTMLPRDDGYILTHAATFSETVTFKIGDSDHAVRGHWSDYVRGVAFVLQEAGYFLCGAELSIDSDVPPGAGLSSSAALEVAVAQALLAQSASEIDRRSLALLCQRAENEFVGVRSGIMDQLAACMGRGGNAMLLDCRSLDIDYVPISEQVRLVVCNSMVKHTLAAGEYNRRREECEQAVKILSQSLPHVRQLRDVTLQDIEQLRVVLGDTLFRRCRHVVSENQRTLRAAESLRENDLNAFGALLNASHESLRDDYEVSCRELDILVEIAQAQNGVYGSRMTGGGFGGCTISIVQEDRVDSFIKNVTSEYARRADIHCETYICEAAGAAREIERAE
jgi:galactokinase